MYFLQGKMALEPPQGSEMVILAFLAFFELDYKGPKAQNFRTRWPKSLFLWPERARRNGEMVVFRFRLINITETEQA